MGVSENPKKVIFSIIIPTYNRLNTLKLILSQLSKQTFPLDKFEVLVIDDGSTDGTKEFLKGYQGKLNLRYFETGLPEETYGYLKALNVGIERAKGEYLVFLDSDMVPKEDALERLYEAHKRWEEKGEKVAIRAWWVRRKNPLKMWLKRETLSRYSPHHALESNKKFRKLYERKDNLKPKDAVSAFLSVKREFALAVGGFINATCYGLDGEFQERLQNKLGVRLVFEPSVYAIHGPLKGDVSAEKYRWSRKIAQKIYKRS